MNAAGPRVRASVVCVHRDRMLVVRYREPGTAREFVGPPGGGIEPDETPARAARREMLEETGYAVRLREKSHFTARYDFPWAGRNFDCLTHWYRADALEPENPPAPRESVDFIVGVEWIPVDRVSEELAYHAVIRDCVLRLLGSSA